MSYKTVHFHKMNYFKKELVGVHGKADELRITYFSERKLKEELEDVIKTKTAQNCLILEGGVNQITLEILDETDDYIFARLGKMQDIKTVHLRNKKTLKASPIQKALDQEIEIFTYLIINKNNMVLTYITEQGAPHISRIENIATRYFRSTEYIEVVPIIVPDALDILKNKKKITKIDYKIALPINELLDKDHLDLPVDEMINLKDLKSATIQVTVTGQKEKNIVNNISDNISKLVSAIRRSKHGEIKQISFNAKNDNEYTHKYNIFEEIFVRKTRMNIEHIDRKIAELDFNDEQYYDKVQGIMHEEIKLKLLSVYHVNEESLEEYIKLS